MNTTVSTRLIPTGGDPYLAALYRRWSGCTAMLPEVTVNNKVGGVQRSDQPYSSPRYSRCSISKEVLLQQLRSGTAVLQAAAFGGDGRRSVLQQQHQQQQGKQAGLAPAGLVGSQTRASALAAGVCAEMSCTQCSSSDEPVDGCAVSAGSGPSSAGFGSSSSNSGSRRRQLAVDVLVPTARLDLQLLQGIVDAVL
jgi:hypothetical protein